MIIILIIDRYQSIPINNLKEVLIQQSMLDKGTCLRYYKRKEIQEAMVEHALNKEVGLRYGESFGKRPDILMYPQEILELAKRGATSFHSSEEICLIPKS